MAFDIEEIIATKEKIIDPRSNPAKSKEQRFKWWTAQNEMDLMDQVLSTTNYLGKLHDVRVRQSSTYVRLYSGKPLSNYLSSTSTLDTKDQLPIGRPTANVCLSCTDTITSRIGRDKPQPVFLTDSGNYKQRRIADQANQFLQGEFYRTKAYDLGQLALRDACVIGDGFLKVFQRDKKVAIERTLATDLLVDQRDAFYGSPRELIQKKLIDRDVLKELFPKNEEEINQSPTGNIDSTPRSTESIADQIIIAEAWHLPSGMDAKDGRHVIVCAGGVILDEPWEKDYFPFVKIPYTPLISGYFSQSLIELLYPIQMEIYRMLIVASQSLELMSVPRILIEEMSKILETSFNNRVGSIIKYRNTPPQFITPQANAPEVYQYIQWLIGNAYQMSGISSLSAGGEKPSGLNSGEAIRTFDGVQDDRFFGLGDRYQGFYKDLGTMVVDCAQEIYEETGEYSTIYPGKDGIATIDFKLINLLKNNYVIQCYEQNSLPKDPAGRQAKLSEMLATGEITQQEFRRLSAFPDLKQSDELANALENRVLSDLDQIIDQGKKGFRTPDPFILDETDLATRLTVNYINRYSVTDIEEEKMDLLLLYFKQVQDLKQGMAQQQQEAMQQAQMQQMQMQQSQQLQQLQQSQPSPLQ